MSLFNLTRLLDKYFIPDLSDLVLEYLGISIYIIFSDKGDPYRVENEIVKVCYTLSDVISFFKDKDINYEWFTHVKNDLETRHEGSIFSSNSGITYEIFVKCIS